tara:strand:+ start:262 stop:450 length:189 start_codon:yes stop_codon:yes gene_type:complete
LVFFVLELFWIGCVVFGCFGFVFGLFCCVVFAFANEKIEVGRYRPLTPIKVFQFFEKIDENE